MEAVLLVVHLVVAVGIIAVVLIQPSDAGGFLGSGGATSNMMMPRRSADLLTRVTTILAGCFFLTSLLLAILAGNRPVQKSILDVTSGAPAASGVMEKVQTVPDAETKPVSKKPETPQAPIAK
jgi:preprotein translocase subunit SecG